MEENTAEKKRESEQEKAKQREKATVRKLLPLSAPNRFNIEALTFRIRLVDEGIYSEEDSFAGERNILVVLETLGFVTRDGNYVYLSKDFAPLFHRWKDIRIEIQREEVDRNAQKKEQLAKIKEKLAKELGASEELKKQAREARKEARRAAKAERIELYKTIGEERDKARKALKAQREALRREHREAKEKMRHASEPGSQEAEPPKQDL